MISYPGRSVQDSVIYGIAEMYNIDPIGTEVSRRHSTE